MDGSVIGAVDAAEFVLSLEKKALGTNYGFPRDIVMFPERKKLICAGKRLQQTKPVLDYMGNISFYSDHGSSKVNVHYGLARGANQYPEWAPIDRFTIKIVRDKKTTERIELPEEVIDEDTIYEFSSHVFAGYETSFPNFGVLTSGIVPQWFDSNDETTVYPEFAVRHKRAGDVWNLISRCDQDNLYTYDCLGAMGHCAVGMTLFDEGVYNVYWHIGGKRFYIGQYFAALCSSVTMLSWRVFIAWPGGEFCYIGDQCA